jgi:hypothetical protein
MDTASLQTEKKETLKYSSVLKRKKANRSTDSFKLMSPEY